MKTQKKCSVLVSINKLDRTIGVVSCSIRSEVSYHHINESVKLFLSRIWHTNKWNFRHALWINFGPRSSPKLAASDPYHLSCFLLAQSPEPLQDMLFCGLIGRAFPCLWVCHHIWTLTSQKYQTYQKYVGHALTIFKVNGIYVLGYIWNKGSKMPQVSPATCLDPCCHCLYYTDTVPVWPVPNRGHVNQWEGGTNRFNSFIHHWFISISTNYTVECCRDFLADHLYICVPGSGVISGHPRSSQVIPAVGSWHLMATTAGL